MHKLRPWLSSIFISTAVSSAAATGLGAGGLSAVLGQPLDFVVQVRLDPAEPQALDCISAEVTVGERQLPATLVRTAVSARGTDNARIRVSTSIAIDEPVIGINLVAGCASRVARRYVLLADPPTRLQAALVPELAIAVPVGALPMAESQPPAAPLPPAAYASIVQPVALVQGDAAPARAERAARARPRVAAAKAAERRGERLLAQRKAPVKAAPAAALASDAPARLKLDLVAPVAAAAASTERQAVEDAIEAVAQAASATRAAAAAASANAERLASMERVVEQLRAEARSNRELAAQLRQRLAETDQTSRWTLPLLGLALALAALAAWLAWRLSLVQRERAQEWQSAVQQPRDAAASAAPGTQPLTAPVPFVTSTMAVAPQTKRERSRSAPAWPPPAPAENWAPVSTQQPPVTVQLPPRAAASPAAPHQPEEAPEPPLQRTDVLPPRVHADDAAARAVSVEELIDLEQQAEFFVVLGQDSSAVELLNEHLRNGGGSSPLPYLKLLEIHQRRGERKAYENIRTRFNQQFNAYAPEWDADHAAGRTLADYSGVLPRLQQVWPRPLDAMAELESLLFRKARGELFELPAYREVLFLYALARDLLDRESVETGEVDLLLPMSDGGEFSSTAPTPFLGLEAKQRGEEPDPHPTLPLDFDLTATDRPTSIFDPLTEIPQTRH